MKLSEYDVKQLTDALSAMLDRGAPNQLDSRGFNKLDYGFARDLHQQYRQRGFLSARQVNALQQTMRKYRRQLTELGFDCDELFQTVEAPAQVPLELKVEVHDQRVHVTMTRFDTQMLSKIKEIPERKFHTDTKAWSFPLDSAPKAAELFPNHEDLRRIAGEVALYTFNVETETTDLVLELEKQVAEKWTSLPNGDTLYSHQPIGIASILSQDHFLLADDMGLGKTRQATIAAIERGGKKLVVCPASVKDDWKAEVLAMDPKATVRICNGNPPDPKREWNIINYDILKKHRKALLEIGFTTLIVDEAHRIKNESQRTAQVLGYSTGRGKSKVKHRGLKDIAKHTVLLTGTPILNRPRELFNLLKALRHPLGNDWWSFARRYCGAKHNGWGWDFSGASNVEELARKLAGIWLQRKKDEVLDLPGKKRQYAHVSVDLRKYEELEDELEEANPLGALQKLKRETARLALPFTFDRVDDILETDEKVLVFSIFTETIDAVKARYGEKCLVIDGRVSTGEGVRKALQDRFNTDPSVRVMVLQIAAGGLGLNLQGASQVVFNDMDWVPGNNEQAEDRCYRIGQERKVTVWYAIPNGTLAETLEAVNEKKKKVIGSVERAVAREVVARREARHRSGGSS